MVFLDSMGRQNPFNIPAEGFLVHNINIFMLNFEAKVSQRYCISFGLCFAITYEEYRVPNSKLESEHINGRQKLPYFSDNV